MCIIQAIWTGFHAAKAEIFASAHNLKLPQVYYKMVSGLTFEMCQKGAMTPEVKVNFIKAIKELEALQVCAITGDCARPLLQMLFFSHSVHCGVKVCTLA